MKKNYLKPLCAAAPMDGLQLMDGSNIQLQISGDTASGSSNGGLSRGSFDDNECGLPSQTSVWDD